jgi:uncharacterized protein
MSAPHTLVLDTNIVLDCFVFRDPAMRALVGAMEDERVRTLVHACTLDELERVLAYPQCRLSAIEQRKVMDRYRAMSIPSPVPEGFTREALMLPPRFPQCRDHDDQPFLALAYHAHADALVTKDKAILKTRRKVRRFGVVIFAPRDVDLMLSNAPEQ